MFDFHKTDLFRCNYLSLRGFSTSLCWKHKISIILCCLNIYISNIPTLCLISLGLGLLIQHYNDNWVLSWNILWFFMYCDSTIIMIWCVIYCKLYLLFGKKLNHRLLETFYIIIFPETMHITCQSVYLSFYFQRHHCYKPLDSVLKLCYQQTVNRN